MYKVDGKRSCSFIFLIECGGGGNLFEDAKSKARDSKGKVVATILSWTVNFDLYFIFLIFEWGCCVWGHNFDEEIQLKLITQIDARRLNILFQ